MGPIGRRYGEASTSASPRPVKLTDVHAPSGRSSSANLALMRRRSGDEDWVTPEQVPTREDGLAILEGAPARFRAAVALGFSGLRVGEVLGLTADRIDLRGAES